MNDSSKKQEKTQEKRANSFAFYANFLDLARLLKKEDRLKFYDAIIEYGIEGNDTNDTLKGAMKMLFVAVKPALESSRRRSLNVQKRWDLDQSEASGTDTKTPSSIGTNPPAGIGTNNPPSINQKGKGKGKGKGNTPWDGEDGFNDFWGQYPNKKAKPRAIKAWRAKQEQKKLPDVGVVLKSLDLWKRSAQWTKDGGAFIPHPASWLNGEQWNDTPGILVIEKPPVVDTRPDIHAVPTALRPATSAKEMYGGEDPNAGLEE